MKELRLLVFLGILLIMLTGVCSAATIPPGADLIGKIYYKMNDQLWEERTVFEMMGSFDDVVRRAERFYQRSGWKTARHQHDRTSRQVELHRGGETAYLGAIAFTDSRCSLGLSATIEGSLMSRIGAAIRQWNFIPQSEPTIIEFDNSGEVSFLALNTQASRWEIHESFTANGFEGGFQSDDPEFEVVSGLLDGLVDPAVSDLLESMGSWLRETRTEWLQASCRKYPDDTAVVSIQRLGKEVSSDEDFYTSMLRFALFGSGWDPEQGPPGAVGGEIWSGVFN